jgi:hypothetical protein
MSKYTEKKPVHNFYGINFIQDKAKKKNLYPADPTAKSGIVIYYLPSFYFGNLIIM